MNEYLYGETLRWSFGFENPNKAAVIFACLLPLCWWAWTASWGIRCVSLRISALGVAACLFLGTGTCLVMTFSRGGLVAGVAALAYIWVLALWRSIKRGANGAGTSMGGTVAPGVVEEVGADGAAPSRQGGLQHPKCWLSVLLVVLLVCLAVWSGLVDRSVEGLGEDASVTNRLDLWRSGLQMAYENPAGFGSGQSGKEFMQWFQGADRTEGYRTMVNSYLTYLVEQGWVIFALTVFGFLILWFSTVPVPSRKATEITPALRASMLAFLVAGFFSTTMEDWRLWVIPLCCCFVLAALWFITQPHRAFLHAVGWGLCGTGVIVVGLWLAGLRESKRDPLARTFEKNSLVAIAPKGGVAPKTIYFLPDEAVLGQSYGKLLRSLALESGVKIHLGDQEERHGRATLGVMSGDAVNGPILDKDLPLLLLAPAKLDEERARAILDRKGRVLLLLPEIDEDGRSAFWRSLAENPPHEGLHCQDLIGVGTRVDWAWDQVIARIRE